MPKWRGRTDVCATCQFWITTQSLSNHELMIGIAYISAFS
ncbi:hypothetical protein HMPREF9999_01370 [Alloprevotella sp. oral taxon 473 str. F0040]|nr:hypothetical protein HMPREF9999_01370 [Alloprevotella sp. oral taxon 473 str. F0040]